MIPHEEAQARVLALVSPLTVETVPLREAAGRVLAEPVLAGRDQPPFDASVMDGYAITAADHRTGAKLRVIGEAGAGHAHPGRLSPGEALRIFTGAPVPEGAAAVVPQEDTSRDDTLVTLDHVDPESSYIRPRGGDFAVGATLPAPRRLSPADLALIAAMNLPDVRVRRRPVVAIVATGDELVMPGETPRPDQIVSANSFALAAMIEAEGGIARILPLARDEFDALRTVLDLTAGADLIVTIGGASVGDHDLMSQRGKDLGLELEFHRIALRPGKPLMAGRRGNVPLLGLPGNPASAMVCAVLFLLPMLRAMQGHSDPLPRPRTARLSRDVAGNGNRAHFMRARLEETGALPLLHPAESQDSSLIAVLSDSNALLFRPIGDPPRKAGETVAWFPF
ncbi:molybdenum cofactor biosynthesis protein MoaA [Haematobacter missouriensis]|uniref:Molybdopterin molybdenumtransferase n=1 Tax=Haematobacter missouriensis TaxID=366616 RepID=A0A212AYN9_9RHOB|nr:gephyrin-like molybdotransferase Glp [Haematobacter missouriensis]KFI33063.1 molybdenum cofactor biosynthesis protein MoaA [Haematobacter missouriensis]OWJ79827.1 molybdopterin molybdenumtransferase MoeA [Haematobacter missouriensis]OWJ86580.1 molybdopterin molybdenumtransferase MoeA [Haematobacter missouriensis]